MKQPGPAFILLFLLVCQFVFSQNKLRITYTGIGGLKIQELYEGDILEYKVKGSHKYKVSNINAFGDSTITFETEEPVRFDQLKLIRVRKRNYHNKLLQKFFIRAAIGYPLLQIINNSINHQSPLVNQTGAIVSASALLAFGITRRLDIKKIRINKRKALKTVSMDYQNLAPK